MVDKQKVIDKHMGRIMGIDYGTKRVGLAVTDPLQLVASALTTIHASELIAYLEQYFMKEKVDIVAIGYPVGLNDEATNSTKPVRDFIVHFKRKFPKIKVVKVDERFTSTMAVQAMITAGYKKQDRANKENIDKISAVIILQSYMEGKNFNPLDRK